MDGGDHHDNPHPQQQHQGVVSDADLSNASQQQILNPYVGENVWPWHPMEFPPPQLPTQHAVAMAHYYEARMRDHAAAYASAAAGAAWAAAQIAVGGIVAGHPPSLPPAPHLQLPVGGYYVDPMSGDVPVGSFGSPVEANWFQENPHDDDSDQERNSRRRKRQQRMPPSSSNHVQGQIPLVASPFAASYAGSHASEERRGRRRLRSDAGSSGDNHDSLNRPSGRRHREIQFGLSSSDGGGSSSVGGLHRHKKKQRQPSDASLLGKTGVSALHEWCDKRKIVPNFVLVQDAATNNSLFEFSVQMDGKEWGRGRGGTKGSAKQEAARKVLQILFPGVVFNESGILIDLSPKERDTSKERKAKSSLSMLEDLAPNLAKSLAIGQDEDNGGRMSAGRTLISKRTRDVYPGTSTTSEDEDENTFYASRGAYVCSTLLHAMVQIDERIKDAPSYSYEVSQIPTSHAPFKLKGDMSGPAPSVVAHRGAFTCTATLRLEILTTEHGLPDDPHATASEEKTEPSTQDDHEAAHDVEENGQVVGVSPSREVLEKETDDDAKIPKSHVKILKAVGMGGTKKESRHVASAKLLSLLFPECNGMAEVKAAAEAAREQYAATKALKLQSKRNSIGKESSKWQQDCSMVGRLGQLTFALPVASDPSLDIDTCRQLEIELGFEAYEDLSPEDRKNSVWEFGRQKQLDDLVDTVLQNLYEKDEEGRYLHELSADDVGRTVLRKAGPEDSHWVDKLLSQNKEKPICVKAVSSSTGMNASTRAAGKEFNSIRFCPGPSITLLLCRAIAPHEDPPLGCAVLTLGFSMKSGKSLRVAQLANEPHLPKERLIECLQVFAKHMKCSLDCQRSKKGGTKLPAGDRRAELVLDRNQLLTVVEAHIHRTTTDAGRNEPMNASFPPGVQRFKEERKLHGVANTLQSVQEESEGSDESDKGNESSGEKRNTKQRDKPSKRSRVN
jgi:hypothetical protein